MIHYAKFKEITDKIMNSSKVDRIMAHIEQKLSDENFVREELLIGNCHEIDFHFSLFVNDDECEEIKKRCSEAGWLNVDVENQNRSVLIILKFNI